MTSVSVGIEIDSSNAPNDGCVVKFRALHSFTPGENEEIRVENSSDRFQDRWQIVRRVRTCYAYGPRRLNLPGPLDPIATDMTVVRCPAHEQLNRKERRPVSGCHARSTGLDICGIYIPCHASHG